MEKTIQYQPIYKEDGNKSAYEVFKERIMQVRDTLAKAKGLENKAKDGNK